jgi:hypothetical protein
VSSTVHFSPVDLFNYISLNVASTASGIGSTTGLGTGLGIASSTSAQAGAASGVGSANAASTGSVISRVGTSSGTSTASGISVQPASVEIPSGALAFYSVVRPVGWAGTCCEVERVTGAAGTLEVDYGSDGFVDVASAESWGGVGNVRVKTWRDTSGNGNDAPQSGTGPLLRSANKLNGVQPITIVPSNGSAGSTYFTIPSSIVLSRRSFSAYACIGLQGGLFNSLGLFGLGTSATATDNVSVLYDNTGGRVYWLDGAFHNSITNRCRGQVGQASIVCIKSDSSTVTFRYNGVQSTATAPADKTLTGGYIGRGSWSSATLGMEEFFALAIYGTTRSASDDLAIEASFASAFDVVDDADTQIIYDGDSITCGYNNLGYLQGYPRQTLPLLSKRVGMVDMAVSGVTMADRYTNRATVKSYYDATKKNIFALEAGTNDIANRASGTIAGYETTIWNSYMQPYIDDMLTAGADAEVCVAEILPRSWTGSATDISQRETVRLNLNILINNYAASNPRVDVRPWAAHYTGSEAAFKSTGTVDGIHPTPATNGELAALDADVFNPLL